MKNTMIKMVIQINLALFFNKILNILNLYLIRLYLIDMKMYKNFIELKISKCIILKIFKIICYYFIKNYFYLTIYK